MPDVTITCKYCDHCFEQWLSVNSSPPVCAICGHKDLKIKEKDLYKNNVFGYDLETPLPDAYFNYRKKS